jgi:hypothetical protein
MMILSRYSWRFAFLIVATTVLTEALPFIFGTGENAKWDWSFLYVTMRFVLLPIACIIHIAVNTFGIIKARKDKLHLLAFGSVIVSVGFLILSYLHPLPLTVWK